MAYDKKIRELRLIYGTTFNTTHTAASNAAWNPGTATKIRAIDWEDNFEYASEADPTLESQIDRHRARILTLRRGKCSFKTFLEGGSANTTANTIATLLSKFFGGLQSPVTNKTDLADTAGTHTGIKVYATGVGAMIVPGQAVLLGTRGDAKGNGEVRLITGEGTDYIDLDMATSGTVADGDAIVYSHTVFLDPDATQNYVDGLVLGEDSTTPDQKQWIGGMGTVGFENLGLGELGPQVKFDLEIGDWAHVASGNKDALSPTEAHVGNGPAIDRGMGGLFIQTSALTTRATIRAGGWSIDPGIKYVAIPDPNGINGIGGFKRVRSDGVKWEFTALRDEALGSTHDLYTKFTAGTAIQLMWQWGHAAQNCVAISMPLCYVDNIVEAELDGLSAVKVSGHATAGTSGTSDIIDSPMAIHFF